MAKFTTEKILKNIDTLATTEVWTSDTFDLTDKYEARIWVDMDNNGNSPTTVNKCEMEVSPDGTTWFPYYAPIRGGLITVEQKHSYFVPLSVPYCRLKITAGSHTMNIQKVTMTWKRTP